jgi:hypothetical protein
MRPLALAVCSLVIAGTIACRSRETLADRSPDRATPPGPRTERFCPADPKPRVVEIRAADPAVDKAQHDTMRAVLTAAVQVPNTTILLGPNVVLDFADTTDDAVPLRFRTCVTLRSVQRFGDDKGGAASEQSARTPSSLGPLLRFGPHRSDVKNVFLGIECAANDPPNDHVRISGFRLYGPSFGQQSDDDIGIFINRCLDIEVSNMEIAGWGGQGVTVLDDPEQGPGQEPPDNRPGERIGRPEQVRIFGNYIHHNQHPRTTFDSHTAGYGVETNHGAWAQITENLFDFNRHAIAAAGDAGGYEARRNLVLKGGGLHYTVPLLGTQIHTHEFDIHGTGGSGKGGQASVQDWYEHNSFQYLSGSAIYVRGRPALQVDIRNNIFAHEGLENDWGDDAIKVEHRSDLDVIDIGPGNTIDYDSYGHYGVCDFDGDGVDDLFLATGRTWWFSSFGEFPWSYLSLRNERLEQVRLGYFDDDRRCDVLTESDGEWVISSGGTGPWTSIGAFGAPLREVVFGRFDPRVRDHRPEATRRTTHAFRRAPDGEWLVSPLSAPNWHHAQSSSFPLSRLRFGDFTGDGVTDVLAVVGGRWAISESAHSPWRRLNANLGDDVRGLFFADLAHDNVDDVIRLQHTVTPAGFTTVAETFTWWVSDDGRSRWRKLRRYPTSFLPIQAVAGRPTLAFAGRFGAAPGGGVLLVGHDRLGRFFSAAETAAGAAPDWASLFAY